MCSFEFILFAGTYLTECFMFYMAIAIWISPSIKKQVESICKQHIENHYSQISICKQFRK